MLILYALRTLTDGNIHIHRNLKGKLEQLQKKSRNYAEVAEFRVLSKFCSFLNNLTVFLFIKKLKMTANCLLIAFGN